MATALSGLCGGVWGMFPGTWLRDASGNKGSSMEQAVGEGLLVPEAGRGPFLTAGAGKGSAVQEPAVLAFVSLMGPGL